MPHYKKPDAFTRTVFNPAVALLMKAGLSLRGSRILAVRGRTSGEMRTTPVNLLAYEGGHYLVAPRGETQWVRNLRAAGEAELRLGRKRQPFTAAELPDGDKSALLRAYLKAWSWEVGQFFDGVKHDAPDADIARIAPEHPVFRITFS